MNVIRQANSDIIRFLGGEQRNIENIKYRFNKYCIFIKQDRKYTIIYNAITGSIVQIKNYELDNLFIAEPCDYKNHLISEYFLVKPDFDEDDLIKNYKNNKQIYISNSYLDNPSQFVIMPTSMCNARCYYCYELGIPNKQHMSKEVIDQVCKYINGVSHKDITISFFGGEPLYNKDVITNIVSRVRSSGKNVKVTMISNGLLFDEDTVEDAVTDWGLQNVQITLDGTEEIYNKTKNYIYKDINAFQTVIKNIHNLSSNGISVQIRLNCSLKNCDNLKELVKFLGQEFKNNDLVKVYVWEVFQDNTPENANKLFSNMQEINDLIYENNLQLNHIPDHGIKAIHCMVDSGDTVFINQEGKIGVCEHYIDNLFVSDVFSPQNKNFEVLKNWRNFEQNNLEICKDCAMNPICLRSKLCTDHNICTPAQKKYLLDRLNKQIIETVNNYHNGNNEGGQCVPCDQYNKQR